ncbi:unnamed protein product [Mytilus edulis]|uniref:Uncharacterized protein n=1 Tax=Mytilus edulis TaxID=6550 RepID=A0A8S3RP74_MYTED|nr:unnamed protein product [Mytilus edulis]
MTIKELFTAIENKNHDEIMRIYYRSQHIHRLDDHSSPMHVEIYVEKDRLNSKWLPHNHNAIKVISIAVPGLKFTFTHNPSVRSTNYIEIGIDKINVKDEKDRRNDYEKVTEDQIWKLKEGGKRCQYLSELDKVALNLMYKPCKSYSTYPYLPRKSNTTNMLYCGRDVMQSHNQNVPPTISFKCGPEIWANCPSCRVFKDVQCYCGNHPVKLITINKCLNEGKWQVLAVTFIVETSMQRNSQRFDTILASNLMVCGPDQGIPCTDCGKVLKPDYSYKDFNRIPTDRNYI